MLVSVRLALSPLRRWHLELLERLSALPSVQASTEVQPTETAVEPGLEWVLALDRRLHHLPEGLSSRVDHSALHRHGSASTTTADLVIDLTSDPLDDDRTWRLEFDGQVGEGAALAALRGGRPPRVTLVSSTRTIVAAVPGSESPGVLATAFDDLLAGCITVIVGGVTSSPFAAPSIGPGVVPTMAPSLRRHAARQLVSATAHRGYRALYRAPHWRVGWRLVDGPGLIDDLDHPGGGWQDLPDDGLRFYADPFPFEHGGELFLFVEDFEHRLGRGVISVVRFDELGPTATPEPVLQHDVHLSYPFVLEDEGELWMIPETSAAGTVELYRATHFPAGWELEAILLKGLEASDATVFRHGGRWWMTATVRDGGSFSDALHLWHADTLTGPWLPHANNPVLLDISSARPAGRVITQGGRLLRPVQDGRAGYGAALAVAEVTRLDDEAFEQRVISRVAPGAWWPGRRLHTLNRAGRLECIDGSAMSPRFRQVRRSGAGR